METKLVIIKSQNFGSPAGTSTYKNFQRTPSPDLKQATLFQTHTSADVENIP